ncbi:BF3164 family lipoprotein [Proteiniphilum sp.]|uniref:BF3164 family lipoprotein n=1 Tax=Proteiniphilum sp. TaxID=1926877 RepID=UPI002B1F34CE|nr:BF3164 family lipoprotein [Proteiniphilum sp.]MEA4918101.1 BF3164 family lipoprotein [Proteiniphilum sp.]
MKTTKIAFFIIILGAFVCCNENKSKDSYYFKGDIQYFDDDSMAVKNVKSKSVSLDGTYTGMVSAYDSLLICWYFDFPNHFFTVFNVDTGDEIGSFVEKGQGPQEVESVNTIFQHFKKGNDITTMLYASNEGKLFFWNISQSVRKGETVYDTIVSYDNDRIFFPFYQSEDMLLAYKPSDNLNKEEATTPFYEKRTIYSNKLLHHYPIYKQKSVINSQARSLDLFFYTWDAIKPDGSKIVQAMMHLPQINIMDTNTGDVVGYRMRNGPDFSLLETDMKKMNRYYTCVHADDDYIYATYWGKEAWNDRFGIEVPSFNTIHVFDWDGNPIYKLITDQSFYRVWSDPVRKRLYTINMNTDEVYYLGLNELE